MAMLRSVLRQPQFRVGLQARVSRLVSCYTKLAAPLLAQRMCSSSSFGHRQGGCIRSSIIANQGDNRNRNLSSSAKLPVERYHVVAGATLEGFQDAFDEYSDDHPAAQLDVEYADGVLNVMVGSHGTFVLNKQAPNLQIWLSSPVTGPQRYDFCVSTNSWLNSRDQRELFSRVSDDFNQLMGEEGMPICFSEVEEGVRSALE